MTQVVRVYHLIMEENVHEFNDKVNTMIVEGWELHGTTYPVHNGSRSASCQAVILLKPKTTEKREGE